MTTDRLADVLLDCAFDFLPRFDNPVVVHDFFLQATDQEPKVVSPAEEPEEMPLPSDPKVVFLGGLFVLALLAAANVASEIVLKNS